MNEIPFFFNNESQQLFAICHHPDNLTKKLGWVFCHPFAEEKLWAHRIFVNIARELSKSGFPVLRFDYRGYGDSDGNFEDYTVDNQLSDIEAAINELQNRYPDLESVGLIGLRYGAVLSSLVANRNENVSHLVLWDPITDMDRYMQDVLRVNLTTQMVMHGKVITNRDELTEQIKNGESVNIDGYELTKKLFIPACKIRISGDSYMGKCQIVQIGRKNQTLKKSIKSLASTYTNVDVDQIVEEQFWKEIKTFAQRSEQLTTSLMSWIGEAVHE